MKSISLRAATVMASCCALLFSASPALADSDAAALAELQQQVRELRDIESIKRVKYAYFRAIDSADLKLLGSLVTDDVEVRFIGGDYDWKLKGRDEYVEAVARNFNASSVTEHNGNHPEINILSETEAEGIWYLHDNFYNLLKKVFTTGSAFYHDRYRKVDGQWRIARTEYKRHYEIVTPFDKMPNITVHYLATHGRVVDRDCSADALCRDPE